MPGNDLHVAQELDAAWLIALWKAIHGGDPSPEVAAGQIIAVLAPYVTNPGSSLTFEQLKGSLERAGIQVAARDEVRPHGYCFTFNGQIICIELRARQLVPDAPLAA
jgi:hypothetical protein